MFTTRLLTFSKKRVHHRISFLFIHIKRDFQRQAFTFIRCDVIFISKPLYNVLHVLFLKLFSSFCSQTENDIETKSEALNMRDDPIANVYSNK
ncbi:hypothetical protein T4A_2635 [Trichinella pseudospiralis]|uniref:Uncharacterized protein n=1 Tax=Trichinella pseudospiralis TaxID=6337 RepID=A0A0V1EVE6_TRIPS|nr:hypothetical protein T4A_2635 [Trichinella pseudospiralis]